MPKPLHAATFSHRIDPAVPGFPDEGAVVFVDATCGACSRLARVIARLDRRAEFRICPAGSPLGRRVLLHYGVDPDDPESWLYLEAGRPFTGMSAVIQAGRRLGGWARCVTVLAALPRPLQDWLYRRIARNRYRIAGRADLCAVADPAVIRRLITGNPGDPALRPETAARQ